MKTGIWISFLGLSFELTTCSATYTSPSRVNSLDTHSRARALNALRQQPLFGFGQSLTFNFTDCPFIGSDVEILHDPFEVRLAGWASKRL